MAYNGKTSQPADQWVMGQSRYQAQYSSNNQNSISSDSADVMTTYPGWHYLHFELQVACNMALRVVGDEDKALTFAHIGTTHING